MKVKSGDGDVRSFYLLDKNLKRYKIKISKMSNQIEYATAICHMKNVEEYK